MSRPYTPGVWAKKYDALPPGRKAAVDREVDRIFFERTGMQIKLDPYSNIDLVRVWLRIRDAVMSGATKAPGRIFCQLDGLDGASKDPRHRGWFDVVQVGFPPMGSAPGGPFSTSGGGGAGRMAAPGVVLWFDENAPIVPLMDPGRSLQSAAVEFSSPGFVMTWRLKFLRVREVKQVQRRIGVELLYSRMDFEYD